MSWFRKGPSSSFDESKEKIFSSERLGRGAEGVIKGATEALFNVLVVAGEGVRWGVSKISEKVGSKDPGLMESRRKIGEHYKEQLKKSGKKVVGGTLEAGKGVVNSMLGGIGVISSTVKDNYNGLRGKDKFKKENDNGKRGGVSGS